MAPIVLVYDSDCGSCTDFKNVVRFLDPRRRLSFASLAEADEVGLLDELPGDGRYKSFHIIIPGKCVTSGADALPVLVGLLTRWKCIEMAARSFPFGFQAISSVYRVLSRLHDSGSCAPDGLVATGSKVASGLGLRPKQN